ncbi:hypothetical protein MKW94_009014 [Papaver nudicaule]|uniref:FACT complex subunit n=1 Tax=Papaver nudicaule TaxID=74823 RepID=A0AA42AUA1_PAPNU|nr:hypothetical protein [Papaver nudicaule]
MEIFRISKLNMCRWRRLLRLKSIDDPIEKEKQRYDQATFAYRLKMEDKRILLCVEPSIADSSDKFLVGIEPTIFSKEVKDKTIKFLEMEKLDKVISLTDVTIFPKVGGKGGETFSGTLEVHKNGFRYKAKATSRNPLIMHIYFDHIKTSFFRLGDEKMPPLLHFRMDPPLQMGREMTTDIEFYLKKSDLVYNEELDNFIEIVDAQWNFPPKSPCLFHELEKEFEFAGVLPWKASAAAFALTLFDLIVLVEDSPPLTVVPLLDIEFVNLALIRPREIDMTVILSDFKEDNVHQIRSIPIEFLARIKHCLNSSSVKYFVNTKELDWKAIVKDIAAFPREFIIKGGWDKFGLEDCDSLVYNGLVKEALDLEAALGPMLREGC